MTSGDHAATVEAREDQPLLGQPGEVVQKENVSIYRNFLNGEFVPDLISGAGTPTDHQFTTLGTVAQVGVWVVSNPSTRILCDSTF